MPSLESRNSRKHGTRGQESLVDPQSPISRALTSFMHLGTEMSHSAHTTVFQEGKIANWIYLVQSGQLKLSSSDSGGRTMLLRIARTGDVLGLSAALNGLPYETTAQTLSPCNLTQIEGGAFLGLAEKAAPAGFQALSVLAREHREIFLSMKRLALFPLASARIAQVLIAFACPEPTSKPASSFVMALNHAELASLVGTSRETVTRLLNRFERDRVIARHHSEVKILHLAKLRQLAS